MSIGIIFGTYNYIIVPFVNEDIEKMKYIELANATYFLIISILIGISNGIGILIAKSVKKDEIECRMLIHNGFCMMALLTLGVTAICILYRDWLLMVIGHSEEWHAFIRGYFTMLLFATPFVVFLSYIMALIQAMENFKIPCIFIVCGVLGERGILKCMLNTLDITFFMSIIIVVKSVLIILMCVLACVYFRKRYSQWCFSKVKAKINLKLCVQCLRAGVKIGILSLPLAFMVLILSKFFMITGIYVSIYLLLGTVIMAPFMARLIVEKYLED